MGKSFKHIGLIGQHRNERITQAFQQLIDYLKTKPVEITIEDTLAHALHCENLKTAPRETLGKQVDLVIVVGGDGSLLQATHAIINSDTPLIGINLGRLGFLTDIKSNELEEKLDALLNGDYITEERFLLEAHIKEHNDISCTALNDIVIASGDTAHMMEFEVYINDVFMCSERSNGMIIATPTGSTAYALSGGGPILQPKLDAIVLVSMFSHTLSSRPIVLPGDSKITIKIGEHIISQPILSADGKPCTSLNANQSINIQKHSQHINLIHPENYDYFENVRSKLYWGQKLS